MAFVFTVETGSADSDANSYTTVEFADDYIAANAFASADWLSRTEDAKQKLLVRASKYLDRNVRWNGTRVDGESGLRWPRSGVYDADGFEIPDDMIPIVLQEAVCELASYLMNDDWTAPQGARGIRELKVDVIDIKFDSDMVRGTLPDFIIQMLSDLGEVNSGRRPAFKQIIRS